MRKAAIVGTGAYLPIRRVRSNDLFEELESHNYGVQAKFFERLTGIKERRIADTSVKPSELAIKAARQALTEAKLPGEKLDLVLFCGIEGDNIEPSTAHRVAHAVGAEPCPAFDIKNACHGFMDALFHADMSIQSGRSDNVLICTGESGGHRLDAILNTIKAGKLNKQGFMEIMGCLSVGDGGGAVVLSVTDRNIGFMHTSYEARGSLADLCYYQYGKDGSFEGQMNMTALSSVFAEKNAELFTKTWSETGWNASDIDYVISHQIGRASHKDLVDISGIPEDRFLTSFELLGNLTTVSIPYNLSRITLEQGKKLLIVCVGSGAVMSQSLYHS